jgi:hypothetical protein
VKLMTSAVEKKLLRNGEAAKVAHAEDREIDPFPVVQYFAGGSAIWLITEMDPDDHDRLFGLCDLGHGSPELGYVSLQELSKVQYHNGVPMVEREYSWVGMAPLSSYVKVARMTNSAQVAVTEVDQAVADDYLDELLQGGSGLDL